MTRNKLDKVLLQVELYYRVFPVDRENINHKIIKQAVPLIKKIMEYRGHTRGKGALPQNFLELKYDGFYNALQDLREQVDKTLPAGKEALRSVEDAEELLDYVFV